MKALVVDDDAELRELILFTLKRIGGLEVDTAESGQEAWKKMEAGFPDLLILDLKMPGVYGTEICAKVRRKDPSRATKIFILTSYLTPNVLQMVQQSGADDWMEKPFNPDVFSDRVRRLTGMPTRS